MIIIFSFACMIGIGAVLLFAWALCRAAGCADEQMERAIDQMRKV